MSEPTYWALCYSGEACFSNVRVYQPGTVLQCYSDADCLSSVRSYLQGTVLQWCRLFKRCQNLPGRALCYSGADCLNGVRTYLPGTVLQGCRLFKRCLNIPTRYCVTVVQTVYAVLIPTCRALCYIGAG